MTIREKLIEEFEYKIILGSDKTYCNDLASSILSLLRSAIGKKKTDVPDDGYKVKGNLTSISAMGAHRAYNQAIDDIVKMLK